MPARDQPNHPLDSTRCWTGAYAFSSDQTVYGDVNIEYKMFGDWTVDLLALVGRDDSAVGFKRRAEFVRRTLALNGTANTGGQPEPGDSQYHIVYTSFR